MRSSEVLAALTGALIACAVALPDAWAAPPTAADKTEAQRLYVDGKSLRDQGKIEESLAKLRRSHELAPTPVTRLELARTLVAASRLVEAHALLESIPAMPVAPTETAKSATARKDAQTLAVSVLAGIPRVTLRVTSVDASAAVKLDGAPIEPARLGVEQRIDPGSHVAVLEVGERSNEVTFAIAAGEAQTIDLALAPLPPPVVAPAPSPRPAPPVAPDPAPKSPPDETEDEGGSPAIPLAFTIAGIGLATGAVTGVIAIAQASELKESCTGGLCRGADIDVLSTHQAITTTSTVAFAVGGAAAAVGIVLVIVDDGPAPSKSRSKSQSQTSLRARWTGTGLAMEGAWQ